MSAATRLALSIVLLAAPAMAAAQTAAAPAAGATPKATASIRGRITGADTGRGLRRAQVSIGGGDLAQRRTAPTNTRGEFEIRDLPPGRYTVSVSRSGYLPFEYGQRRVGERGKSLELAEGEALAGIDVALPRASVISGRVIDENSEPVPGVSLWIMRPEFFRGRKRLVPVTVGVRTDDIGQYRATGLAPGEYVVFATLRETWTVTAGGKQQVLGYAPTYFPGTVSVEHAQQVKVAAGKEAPNVDIALVAAPAVTVAGTARRTDGAPLAGAAVSLSHNMFGPGGASFNGSTSVTVSSDGSWILRDVPPGEYELRAASADRNAPREVGLMKLVVQGVEIDGVSLVTEAPARITGEVATDTGAALPQTSGARFRVFVETNDERPPDSTMGDPDNGQIKSDGAFTVIAASGSSLLRVSPLPRGWAIRTVEIAGREIPDGALELKGGQHVQGVRIVLTDRFPSIAGRITDDRAQAAEGTVVLFPVDESRWLTATAGIRSGRTDQKGLFRLESIPPGDYFVAAVDAVQNWQVNDPEFLEDLKARAERVTVREGAAPQLALRILK